MEERLALERRRERNRIAQRKHRENVKVSTKGMRSREPSSDCSSAKSLPEQNSLPGNRNSRRSGFNGNQESLPFSAIPGPGLDYSMDQLSTENLFPDMLLAPQAPEYSHIGLTSSTSIQLDQCLQPDLSPYTMDTVFSSNPSKPIIASSLCANCHPCAKPQSLCHPSPANTPTQPISQHKDQDARTGGISSSTWTTPLHISVTRGHLSAVRLLLDRGADPNAVDGEGSTVLHTAVRSGHHTIVRELLRHHADPGSVDAAGWLPLHYAAEAGDENCLRALLQTSGEW
ncbi:hypothetical protein BBP40_007805 [Aspergillus hancockii]|nr:hypothetical protein BBP40_007805 [Aspergillus hancockii]